MVYKPKNVKYIKTKKKLTYGSTSTMGGLVSHVIGLNIFYFYRLYMSIQNKLRHDRNSRIRTEA